MLLRQAWLIVVFSLFFSVAYADDLHSNIVIFGDSLSDSQTPSTNDPGYAIDPRMWGQYLVLNEQSRLFDGSLKTYADSPLNVREDNINFAHGGATTICASTGANCLATQVNQFLGLLSPTVQIEPYTKIIIWIGGNDLLNNPSAVTSNPRALINNIISQLTNDISAIEAKETVTGNGPYTIYIADLPPLGLIPKFNNVSPAIKTAYLNAATTYSQTLAQLPRNPNLNNATHRIVFMPVSELWTTINNHLAAFGFYPPTSSGFNACNSQTPVDPKCLGFLFYDDIHPTTQIHAYIAQYFATLLYPTPTKHSI